MRIPMLPLAEVVIIGEDGWSDVDVMETGRKDGVGCGMVIIGVVGSGRWAREGGYRDEIDRNRRLDFNSIQVRGTEIGVG